MNTPKRIVFNLKLNLVPKFLALVLCAMAVPAFAQLQWSSYDTSGNLVTANVATGGDVISGNNVTFTIPAGTQLFFLAKGFKPFNLTTGTAGKVVRFQMSASGGLSGAPATQRIIGWGCYNSAGTASLADDVGYFGMFNAGNYTEPYYHSSGSGNLFSGTKPGQGTTTLGFPADNVTYTNQLYLKMNALANGISLGTGGSTLAAAGVAIVGPGVTQYSYINPVTPVVGGVSTFDEFGFMFNNTSGSSIIVTLSALSLVDTVTWDASGTSPLAPTDGNGSWSVTNVNWAAGAVDNGWTDGQNAILGSGGAGGTITVTSPPPVVANITFNTNYTIAGNPLTLTNSPTITVNGAANTATISSVLAGTGFTKEGAGTLTMGVANTYTGDTIINNGTLRDTGAGGVLVIPGNLVVNPNGTFSSGSGGAGQGVFASARAVVNGGVVTNNVGSGIFAASLVVLANNGTFANGGSAVSATYAVTNTDARSGINNFTRHGFGVFNNIYKSTAGTATIGTRPNSSGTDGYIVTVNAGTLIFDKSIAANNANRLKVGSPLTFAGGRLQFNNTGGLAYTTENPSAAGTFFNSGASSLYETNNGSGGSVTFGPLNRKTGATFNLVKSDTVAAANIGSTVANVNGIVGGWNTFNLTDWTAGTTAWAALAPGNYTTSTDPTTWAAANNVSLNASTSPNVPDLKSINTLRLTAASTVTLDGSLTLSSGGLLVTGSGATAIAGGTLKGASGLDLIVHQNASADLTISSTLADNGSATSLTKDGAGKLIITGTDNLTGTNFLNGGAVEVNDLAKLASGPLDMNGGTLRYTGSDTTSSRTVATRGLGPIFDVVGGTKLTQSGAITGSGDAIGDFGGLTKIGNGTLILSASNYFNGELVISNGVLAVNGTNACNNTVWDAGRVTVYGGTLGGNGVVSGPVTIKNGATISPGNSIGTLSLSSGLVLESGSTNLFEVTNNAAGDLLVVQGNLTIATNSTIAINVLGAALEVATNTLITYTGTKSGSFNPTVMVNGSLNSSVTIDESTPGQIKLISSPQVAIIGQPQDLIVSTNDPATFTVTATGTAPIGYQWYSYGNSTNNTPTLLNDETNASFTIASAQSSDIGLYAVVVSNGFNSVLSRFASLIVGNVAPILNGPFNQTVIQGNNATFSASVVIANPQPTFQWQTNGVDVPGATTLSLTLNNVQYAALNGATISLIASNAAALVTNSATLTVIVPPVITPQPTDLTVNVGDPASFVSGATGIPTPNLQWRKNGLDLSGENSGTLSIASAQGGNIGLYSLVASNAAGSVTSSVVRLTVNSTSLATTALAPANAATGICYDTPLYITFNGPISIINSGKVRIFNSTNTVTPVATIDMSSNSVVISSGIGLVNNIQPHSLFSGDTQVINYFPVIITGNTAAIYPSGVLLTSNQTYYVTMDNGIVADSNGAYFAGISDTNAWRFTTKPTGPANPTHLVVAADGTRDFVTVQGAVDFVPPGNSAYTEINIRNGNYVEIVDITGKNNLTFRGQSRLGTVVGYPNNNNLTGTTAARMAFKVNSADIKLENLTLTNGTPQGGSQAETLLIYNSGLRCVVDNCDIVSRQDTILINAATSQGYFNNCRIVGNFDYVWGVGVGYFNNCVIHTITNTLSGSYNLTAARTFTSTSLSATTPWVNPNGTTYSAYGFTFVSCKLEADTGVTGITLAGSNGTVGGQDDFINCCIDTNAYVTPTTVLSNQYVFWQYSNYDITCTNPISFANVQTIGITNNDPRLLAATNSVVWFSGWLPVLPNTAPTLNPVSDQTVNVGVTVNIANVATDPDVPPQSIAFSQIAGPGSVDSGTGIFTWRPTVAFSDTTNAIQIVATDNGTPNLSATNSFNIIVNPLSAPTVGDSSYAGGQFSLTVNGQAGPDYAVEVTTDLGSGIWTTLFITNSPPVPFTFTDTNGPAPVQFYRIKAGPPLP